MEMDVSTFFKNEQYLLETFDWAAGISSVESLQVLCLNFVIKK